MSRLEPVPMRYRMPDATFPRGWYCLAESADVTADALKSISCIDRQFVAFRRPDGTAQVADAYCPHLGAHLASHDGCIENGAVVCPFHKWRFDCAGGRVVGIPYSRVLPPGAALSFFPTREVDGMVLSWYAPDDSLPDHEPFASPWFASGNWTRVRDSTYITTSPFRDILENLFDAAHIMTLHGGAEPANVSKLEFTDYGAHVDYVPGKSGGIGMEHHFTGVTLLSQYTAGEGWETVFVTSFTPLDGERFAQRIRLHAKVSGAPRLLEDAVVPWIDVYLSEVEKDLQVLNYKKHLAQPRLCAGDGPILKFREYSQRFYS